MSVWNLRLLGGDVLTGPGGTAFPAKHQECIRLIKYIACHGRSGIASTRVAEALYDSKWDDPQNGLRTQLARTNTHCANLGGKKLLERCGEKIKFSCDAIECDLWDLLDLCSNLTSNSPEDQRRAATTRFTEIVPESLEEALRSELDALCATDIAEAILKCLGPLSLLPSAGSIRLKLVQITSVIRPYLSLNSLHVEALLKLYAATHCRQELLQTYLDYEALLSDDLGEPPSTRIRDLCESLLRQLELPRNNRRLEQPEKPEVTFGRVNLIEKAAQLILKGGKIYVGGVAGVGKTHLMTCVLDDRALKLFRFAWINLSDESPDDLSQILPETPADVLVVDGYSAKFAETVNFLERVCRFHAIVVVGSTPVGFSYTESLTVRPLEVGSPAHPGDATLLLEHAIGETVTPVSRECAISLAKSAGGLPLSLKLVATLAKSLGIRAVAAQFEANPQAQKTANEFLRAALSEALSQFEGPVRDGVIALAGFGERVPLSLASQLLNLDLWALKRLTDSGLVIVNSDLMEIKAPETVIEQISFASFSSSVRQAQVEFEHSIVERCIRQGIDFPKDELLISHLRILFRVVKNLVGRGEIRLALELLTILRPHASAFPDGTVDPAELEATFWSLDVNTETFARYALAIGTLYVLRIDSKGLEGFLIELLGDERFCKSPAKKQIEIYSQLGLGLRLSEKFQESERIFDVALGMLDASCPPALELKLLHNKSITLAAIGKYSEALETKRAAIKLAEFAPNDHYRVELLHMEAVSMWEADYEQSEVKSAFLVALAYARMYKLVPQEGWILQNATKLLTNSFDLPQSVIVGAFGIGLQITEGLTPEVRRQVKGTCELLHGCLTSLKLSSLALEAKLIAERLTPLPLHHVEQEICLRSANSNFQLPYSLHDTPVSFVELSNFVSSCIRIVAGSESANLTIAEWGLDVSKWTELGAADQLAWAG